MNDARTTAWNESWAQFMEELQAQIGSLVAREKIFKRKVKLARDARARRVPCPVATISKSRIEVFSNNRDKPCRATQAESWRSRIQKINTIIGVQRILLHHCWGKVSWSRRSSDGRPVQCSADEQCESAVLAFLRTRGRLLVLTSSCLRAFFIPLRYSGVPAQKSGCSLSKDMMKYDRQIQRHFPN